MTPGELAERTAGNSLTAEATGRMVEHLKVHHVDLAQTPLTLGAPVLETGKEHFTGVTSAANACSGRTAHQRPFHRARLV